MENNLVDCYTVGEEQGKMVIRFKEQVDVNSLFNGDLVKHTVILGNGSEINFITGLKNYTSTNERVKMILKEKDKIDTRLKGAVVITGGHEVVSETVLSFEVMEALVESFKSIIDEDKHEAIEVDIDLFKTLLSGSPWLRRGISE